MREWHSTQMRKALAQLNAGSDPSTNTHLRAMISALYCVSVQPINPRHQRVFLHCDKTAA